MSIDEQAVIDAVLAHVVTQGYTTSDDEHAPSDFARVSKPFAFVTGVVTTREALEDVQTADVMRFTLHLWRDSNQRAAIIADIRALFVLFQGDPTLGGVCDIFQALDAVQVSSRDIDTERSYWTLAGVASFES